MTFIPSKLGIPRSTGTYPVKWENPGWDLTGVYDYWLWGDDYSEEGPLDVTISNASTSGCTINFRNPSTITTDSSTIFRLYPKGLTTAQLEDTMPVYLHSKAPGYYPANGSITVPNTGGTYTVEYILSRADIIKWTCDVVNATALVSVEVLEWDSCSIKFKITVDANTEWNTNLTGTIQLGAYYETNKFISYSYGFTIEKSGVPVVKNGSSVINTSFNIVQEVKADISPIWKDYIWEEETLNDFIEYHLDYAGDTIYAGKAYKYPDATGVQFLLNDVSEDFLDNGIIFPSFGKTEIIPNYLKTFTLITSSGSEKPVTFFNDWSYKDTDLTKPYFLSDPISTLVDSRQYVLCSWIFPTGEGVLNKRYTTPEGVVTTVDITLRQGINGYTYAEPLGNLLLECKSKYEIGFVESGSFTTTINYQIDTTNKNYVLYYTNAYGGWDSLLVQGNVKQTDQIESQTYVRKVLNTTSQFSKNKYLNTIVPEWTLYTNYLTDTQASKMHHLLESTMVYLHNLEDNKIIPVIITNNSCEYKTYSNQGKNMFYYTIEVQSSQDKYRK